MTLHFDLLMLTGACMIPGAFIIGWLLIWIFQREEIGAMIIGGWAAMIIFVLGIAVFLVGLGQEIH